MNANRIPCCNMKLSIITVNLNNRDGLQKTIDSVICQTFKDFEWIVIDGGSTDGSKELIEQYSEHFSYWVSEPDKGIYNAMNKGISHAVGDYCLFLNSGDSLISKDIVSYVFSSEHKEDIIFGYSYVTKMGLKVGEFGTHSLDISPFNFIDNTIAHQSSFIKRELFYSCFMYDESYKIAADLKFFFYCVYIKKVTCLSIDVPVSNFEIGGISNSEPKLCADEKKRILEEFLPKGSYDDYFVVSKGYSLQNEKAVKMKAAFSKYWITRKCTNLLYKLIS